MGYLLDKLTEKPAPKPTSVAPPKPPAADPSKSKTLHPDRVFDLEHPTAPDPTKGALFFNGKTAGRWAEDEAPQRYIIPAPTETDRNRIKLGAADHRGLDIANEAARHPQKASSNPGYEGAGKIFGSPGVNPMVRLDSFLNKTSWTDPALATPLREGETPLESFATDLTAFGVTAAEVTNDLNSRVGDARRDLVNDPKTKADDRPVTYEVPSTHEKFKNDQKVIVYKFKDGTIMSEPDYKAMVAAGQATAYRFPNGKQFTVEQINSSQGDDWELIKDKRDPRFEQASKAKDGNRYYCNSFVLPGGVKVSRQDMDKAVAVALVDPKSGRAVPFADNIPDYSDKKAWQDAVYEYQTPKGTTIARKDATGKFVVPPGMQQPYMTQDAAKTSNLVTAALDQLNLYNDNARPPWQDESGRNAWDKGYDINRNAIGEVLPWFIDSQLSSAPYYVPVYGKVSGAASAVPYMYGVRGSTYKPKGSIWDLAKPPSEAGSAMSLGDGTYSDEKITNAQAVGGMTMGVLDALAERWSGSAVGGLAKSPLGKLMPTKMRDWFGKGAGRVVGSGIVEGAEELVSGPSQTMEDVSAENYGRPRYMNEQTGQWEYDKTKPAGLFTQTAVNDAAQNFLSGAALGGTMDGLLMLRERGFNKKHGIDPDAPKADDVPKATTFTKGRSPDSSLNRRYDRLEF